MEMTYALTIWKCATFLLRRLLFLVGSNSESTKLAEISVDSVPNNPVTIDFKESNADTNWNLFRVSWFHPSVLLGDFFVAFFADEFELHLLD